MSLTDQINAVIAYANRNGFPDAADWITKRFHRREDDYSVEPPLQMKIQWIRWYRGTTGATLRESMAAYMKRTGGE